MEEALRAWKEVDQARKPQGILEELNLDFDKASTSMSSSKLVGFINLLIEIGGGLFSSCDDNDFVLTSYIVRTHIFVPLPLIKFSITIHYYKV